mmetsp:Transcript_30816/g.56374  ORF Transcript_30816/g.56374 Transcript_30816/m.56374 type:complete len:205 (+) Transcript_30816:173-787(+)
MMSRTPSSALRSASNSFQVFAAHSARRPPLPMALADVMSKDADADTSRLFASGAMPPGGLLLAEKEKSSETSLGQLERALGAHAPCSKEAPLLPSLFREVSASGADGSGDAAGSASAALSALLAGLCGMSWCHACSGSDTTLPALDLEADRGSTVTSPALRNLSRSDGGTSLRGELLELLLSRLLGVEQASPPEAAFHMAAISF